MYTGSTFNKTRIAPTPSGYLHLGNVLSFAITAHLAKKTGTQILLRIDDLDRARVHKEYVQDIFDTLHFMGIPWHEGPRDYHEYETRYSQVHRMHLYNKALEELKECGRLFACTCSRTQLHQAEYAYHGQCHNKEIPFDAPQASWRVDTTAVQTLMVKTFKGSVDEVLPGDVNDFVVRKKDGYPAYHLASVVDDLHFGVDLIVRGDDLWHSTLAQQYLAAAMQQSAFAGATFVHHQLLAAPTGEKLSKSAGATSVQYLRRQGKSASDIYTMIAGAVGSSERVGNWDELGEVMVRR